jgi:hypothetical protein
MKRWPSCAVFFFAGFALASNAGFAKSVALPQTGCGAWRGVNTLNVRGASEADGLRGTFVQTLDVKTGRHVTQRDYGVFATAEGFDGELDWARDRSGGSHVLDASAARAIAVTQAWLRRRGWCEPVKGEVVHAPDAQDGQIAETLYRVTPDGGIPAMLRFDRATGLLHQSEIHLWGNTLIRHFADWHDIGGGVLVAFNERDEDPEDESTEIIKVASATADRRQMSRDQFRKPDPPQDSTILGQARSARVHYEDDGVGRIYVPVLIDGEGPFPFEIDSGGHFILDAETAASVGLHPVGSANATGAGTGIAKEGVVRVREIRIGDAIIRDQPAFVRAFSRASNDRGPRRPRAGILGLELFERFAVTLERRTKTVTLTPLERFVPPAHAIALPIRFIEDAPITQGSFNGVAGDFELDSGDAGPAIIEGYWAERHGLGKALAQGLAWTGGSTGGGDYRETLSRGDFTLGALKLPREAASYVGRVPRGSESTELQAGVIGESSLYRYDMTYDYRDARVYIDPEPKASPRPFNRAGLRLKKEAPDGLTVAIVVPNSPAEAAQIEAGDKILSIAGRRASDLAASDAIAILSGPVGTKVPLVVVAKDGAHPRPVTLTLREILP